MAYTRVKICGITSTHDAASAIESGADAIGLNFFSGPRRIDFPTGEEILRALPENVLSVGLFHHGSVDRERPYAGPLGNRVYCMNHLKIRQIYGLLDETPSQRSSAPPLDQPTTWLPASISSRDSISQLRHSLEITKLRVGALLLDTASKSGQLGGTGQSFNWRWIAEARDAGELEGLPPIILAGGLNPDNVADAIRIARPYAVDVSSGVEVPNRPGIKDPIKMRDFIQAAKSAT